MKSTSMSPGYNISFYVFYLFETEFVLVICYFCSNIDYFDGFLLRLFFFSFGFLCFHFAIGVGFIFIFFPSGFLFWGRFVGFLILEGEILLVCFT